MTEMQSVARALLVLAVLGLSFAPSTVEATILLDMSIEELTTHADCVVIADIEGQWVEFDDEASQTHTFTTFRVVEVIHVGAEMGAGARHQLADGHVRIVPAPLAPGDEPIAQG